MSEDADRINEQARFAAREFVARFAREMGAALPVVLGERMLFAYEMGYLRGAGDSSKRIMQMFDKETHDGTE
jgi:hypothetical protein